MRLATIILRLWLTVWMQAIAPRVLPGEQDYPVGHPARFDYDPKSPEAKEWHRRNTHPKGERDWPVDHPAAVDTKGNKNAIPVRAGVDPNNPELEAFTGRTPQQAAAVRKENQRMAKEARDSLGLEPIEAPEPPPPGDASEPAGQPSVPVEVARAEHRRKPAKQAKRK